MVEITSKQAGAAISGVMGAIGVQSTALSALAGFAMAGAILLLVFPMHTFVGPVWKEGSVGDVTTVHAYLLGLFNSVAWALYAGLSLPFLAIHGVGILLHLFYVVFYLWFATGKKRAHALLLLLFTLAAVSLVFPHAWRSTTTLVAVMASASGASMHIAPVRVMKSKQQVNNMNPMKALLSIFNGSTMIAHAFISVPVNFYVVVPNLIGIVSAVFQVAVYLVYRSNSIHTDAVNYGYEMRELFTSPV